MKRLLFIRVLVAAALLLVPMPSWADDVAVAVAANFGPVVKDLQENFEKKTGHKLVVSFGSSGAFYAQIQNGAPFEVLLSADSERPKKLEEEKLAVAGSRFTYAIGKLVLWSPKPGVVDKEGAVLKQGKFAKLAIADPKTAPYGAAAKEALQSLQLWDGLTSKTVQGIDIAQTYQFVSSGNAELGFVAYSQILAKGEVQGSFWTVPAKLYSPIEQQAVLLSKGKDSKAAQAFLDYLKSEEAQAVIQSFGYEVGAAVGAHQVEVK
jgi:molybdate transport system substrate-binding protein